MKLLIDKGLISLYLPRCIFEEISARITEEIVFSLGIILLPVDFDLLRRAQNLKVSNRLSDEDRILLLLAESRQAAVWTNDRLLGRTCAERHLCFYRTFGVLQRLVDNGFAAASELDALKQRIEQTNPWLKGKLM